MREYIVFLNWLSNRLIYKYGYSPDDQTIQKIISLTKDLDKKYYISDSQLDDIIRKYYADFDMEYSNDIKLGFTNKERENLRSTIRSIVQDVNNLINH